MQVFVYCVLTLGVPPLLCLSVCLVTLWVPLTACACLFGDTLGVSPLLDNSKDNPEKVSPPLEVFTHTNIFSHIPLKMKTTSIATLMSNLGYQLCLKSCIAPACKLGHEVALLSRCDQPPTHPPPNHFSQYHTYN